MDISGQSQEPQPITAYASEDKRWRPEEIGLFDGTGDAQAFVDRIRSVATRKGYQLVQTHLITVLKGLAFNWYQYELTQDTKDLMNLAVTIEPWC